jgi:hypothetical protein
MHEQLQVLPKYISTILGDAEVADLFFNTSIGMMLGSSFAVCLSLLAPASSARSQYAQIIKII